MLCVMHAPGCRNPVAKRFVRGLMNEPTRVQFPVPRWEGGKTWWGDGTSGSGAGVWEHKKKTLQKLIETVPQVTQTGTKKPMVWNVINDMNIIQ